MSETFLTFPCEPRMIIIALTAHEGWEGPRHFGPQEKMLIGEGRYLREGSNVNSPWLLPERGALRPQRSGHSGLGAGTICGLIWPGLRQLLIPLLEPRSPSDGPSRIRFPEAAHLPPQGFVFFAAPATICHYLLVRLTALLDPRLHAG